MAYMLTPVSKPLPNPPTNARLTDLNGDLSPIWSAWFEQSWVQLVAQVSDLETTVANLEEEIKRNAISSSSTVPTALLSQADTGTDVLVTMAAHKRLYDGGTSVDVNSATTHVPYTTDVAFYYDDPLLQGGTVVLSHTIVRAEAQANFVPGRHALGSLTTMAAGAAVPPVGGGSYPPGGGGGFKFNVSDLS